MFAGRQRRSSNIKFIQLFHELKQRFPTVPDHIVSSYITTHVVQTNNNNNNSNAQEKPSILEYIENTLAENPPGAPRAGGDDDDDDVQMGRPASQHLLDDDVEMREDGEARPKRPDRLDIRPERLVDDRFDDVVDEAVVPAKLLAGVVSEKPPRSPLAYKRLSANKTLIPKIVEKSTPTPDSSSLGAVKRRPWSIHGDETLSPITTPSDDPTSRRKSGDDTTTTTATAKKETCSTPTQTTDTLLGGPPPNLNLSLNVNLDLHRKPEGTSPRPWMQPPSPRSITSVNLTVRSPTKSPQEQPKSSQTSGAQDALSSEQQKANRWQITVIPSGGRVRPRSYHPQESRTKETVIATRAGSLDNLAVSSEPPVILKQKARLERLRSELKNERSRLERVKQEIHELEKSRYVLDLRIDKDFKKQLELEVRHLMASCKDLEFDTGLDEEFYNNIYTGQQGPLAPLHRQFIGRESGHQQQRLQPQHQRGDVEGPKWNCGLCTFLNHPDLDKCEECEMPRIVHGTRSMTDYEAVNPNVTIGTLQMLNRFDRSVSMGQVEGMQRYPGQTMQPYPVAGYDPRTVGSYIVPSHSAPNMLSRLLRRSGS